MIYRIIKFLRCPRTLSAPCSEEPLEFFEKFFDDEVFEYLCTEINRFAKEYFDEKYSLAKRFVSVLCVLFLVFVIGTLHKCK